MATTITDNKDRLELVGELVKLGKLTLAEAIKLLKVEDAEKEKEYIFLPNYVYPVYYPQPYHSYPPYPPVYPIVPITHPTWTINTGTPICQSQPAASTTPNGAVAMGIGECKGTINNDAHIFNEDQRIHIVDLGGTGGKSIVVFPDCAPMPLNSTSPTPNNTNIFVTHDASDSLGLNTNRLDYGIATSTTTSINGGTTYGQINANGSFELVTIPHPSTLTNIGAGTTASCYIGGTVSNCIGGNGAPSFSIN